VEKCGIRWTSEEVTSITTPYLIFVALTPLFDQNVSQHFAAIATAMDDPELPVRVQAVLALTEMVTVHDSGA